MASLQTTFVGTLSSRELLQNDIDLAEMVRLVFANMEPFAKIICGSPTPCGVDRHEPFVVTLAQLG
jgi:hypothetical protein